jgi:hypothetical protein
MKQLLTVGQVRWEGHPHDREHFIMGNHGQVEGTPYFETYRDCMIAILKLNGKKYTNIYDMSEKAYQELIT